MKTQTHLSELDATKLANLHLRRQLLEGEFRAFLSQVSAEYGNEGERIEIQADNRIVRKPTTAPPKKAKR